MGWDVIRIEIMFIYLQNVLFGIYMEFVFYMNSFENDFVNFDDCNNKVMLYWYMIMCIQFEVIFYFFFKFIWFLDVF